MGPVLLGMRAELRLRWRAVVGLALLLGLVAGVALTAAAGAVLALLAVGTLAHVLLTGVRRRRRDLACSRPSA
jgi:hypothetical protein